MPVRAAEEMVRPSRFGARLRLRVDLHGVSVFGPGEEHTVVRWEWIEAITDSNEAVVVRSASATITIPAGTFGLAPSALVERLQEARSIERRVDVIDALAGGGR